MPGSYFVRATHRSSRERLDHAIYIVNCSVDTINFSPVLPTTNMELDIENFEALRQYLTRQEHIDSNDTIFFKNLAGGISNRTVKVIWQDGRGWVLKQALEKLRVSVDWFSDPERIQVEAKALQWLNYVIPGAHPGIYF